MKSKFRKDWIFYFALIFILCSLWGICGCSSQRAEKEAVTVDIETLKSRLSLETEIDEKTNTKISKGTFAVFEDRKAQKGRMIHLNVVILHVTGENPKSDPVFILAGGPGEDAAKSAKEYRGSWMRKERDLVFVSQRGTSGDNFLNCDLPANDDNLQGYIDPLFNLEAFRACLEKLKQNFDLTKYSTCLAMDDLNDIRWALGYDKINLTGGSYGTRAALVYMRRHPETIRTAILNGIAPIAFKNPLFHAPAIHEAVPFLFAECVSNPKCHTAFPNLEDEFHSIMERLDKEPVDVTIKHPVTKKRVPIKLDKEGFVEALRTMMYSMYSSGRVPYLIHRAFEGDFEPFAQLGMLSNRGIQQALAFGMLLCVTCAEDLARITEDEIVEIASGTIMGDGRVRRQKAICEFWPKSDLPKNYGDPVSVDVPVLLLSGTLDPVTPPRWGAEAESHLPNSLHLVVPGAHGVGGFCIRKIQREFLETGSVEYLDISCTEKLKIHFYIPKKRE